MIGSRMPGGWSMQLRGVSKDRLRSQAVLQCKSATYAELGRSDAPPPQRGQHCGQLAGWTLGSCSGFQALLPLLCCPLLLCVGVLQGRRRGLTAPSTWQLANFAV